MWLVVEDCLLGGGQLVHVDGPVSLDDEQRASADDGVPGRLESLQDWPGVPEQGRGDMGVLGLDEVAVGDVCGSQERVPGGGCLGGFGQAACHLSEQDTERVLCGHGVLPGRE